MKTRPALGLLVVLLAAPVGNARAQELLSPETLYEKVAPSIVMIGTFNAQKQLAGLGSGVVIGPAQVVTNCHVLRKATSIYIKSGNATYKAILRHPDPERDLCQLEVTDLQSPAVEIGSIKDIRIGQKVYALGNPRGLERTLSDGLVSALRGENDDQMIQTTAPLSPGSSGGGLFDARGRLVGITSRGRRDGGNIGFAIPADWISEVPGRAKEQLARYRDRASPAAPAESASREKILTAEELVVLFRTPREFRISMPPGFSKLVFRSDSSLVVELTTLTRAGQHRVSVSSNQLCLKLNPPRNAWNPPLNDCFTVSLISERKYRFTSTDKSFVMEGEL